MNSLSDFGDAKYIPLTRGKMAIVDACDYEYLNQWKWCFCPSETTKSGGYAGRVDLSSGKRVKVAMHRLVYSRRSEIDISSLKDIDHKNREGLDNRFDNLRHATRSQNSANRLEGINNTSGYKGVKSDPMREGVWIAQINENGKRTGLGYFNSPEEAALAYNEAAIRIYGEFACLNQVEGVTCFERRVFRSSQGYIFKGVAFHKKINKWQAYAKGVDGKRKHIGYFKTEQEAIEARAKFIESLSKDSA